MYNVKNFKWFGFFVAGLVITFNFSLANLATSLLPVVDGWAVLDRILHFADGELTWPQYIFRPHGAHLHSIVYLLTWIDYHFFSGQQQFTKIISYGATALVCFFFTNRYIKFALRENAPKLAALLLIATTVALITSVVDTETMLQPFQVVLSVARLSYLLLLWYLIVALTEENTKLYVVVMLLSLIAVTFHGTGYIFSVTFVLAHLLACRNRFWMAICVLPFVATFAMQALFSQGNGELSSLGTVMTWRTLVEFFPAVFAYFSTPLLPLLHRIGFYPLLVVGCIMFLSTTLFTMFAVLQCFGLKNFKDLKHAWSKIKNYRHHSTVSKEHIFLALLGFFVLSSGAAAALFWIVRAGLPGALHPPFLLVFDAARYGAFSLFSYVILMCIGLNYLVRLKKSTQSTSINLIIHTAFGLIFIAAMLGSFWTLKDYDTDDRLNISGAAISIRLSPLEHDGSQIWPGANQDWYWSKALPETVASVQFADKGMWQFLPHVAATPVGGIKLTTIQNKKVSVAKSSSDGKICQISGTVEHWLFSESNKSRVIPLMGTKNKVVGYAVLVRRKAHQQQRPVIGYALCDASKNIDSDLMLAEARAWINPSTTLADSVSPVNITDSTWQNGVARNWAGYFVLDTEVNRKLFVSGKSVRLGNGKIRTIVRQEAANGYLNIFLAGPVLNGVSVGYPRKITAVN